MQRGMAIITFGALVCLSSMAGAQTIVHGSRDAQACYSTGDVNGNGISLTVADLTALIAFVNNGILPNGPLWQCDLNGDGYVDQFDIDIYQCYFIKGLSCFPIYPVPTDCDPDTVRGACCKIDTCRVRSSANCALVGGQYQGDGTDCDPNPCLAGACCWPDGSCTQAMNPADDCITLGGQWMGVGVPCSPNPCGGCVKPPDGLLAWWPLEDGISTIGKDIAGAHDGTIPCGTPAAVPEPAGKVGGAARFSHDYSNLAPLRIWDDPFDEIGGGDFTIDAWIYPEALPYLCPDQNMEDNLHCEYRIILDNHVNNRNTYADHNWHDDGVTFFVKNPTLTSPPQYPGYPGQLGLVMNTSTFLSTTAPVVLNQWQHVAVTVSRTTGTPVGIFYYNGVALPPNPFTPISGNLYFSGIPGWPLMDIGHATPQNCGSCPNCSDYFNGVLDEVQIFNRALTPTEVFDIADAGEHGKCRSRCFVPRRILMRPAIASKTFTLTILDESAGPGPISYNWGIASSPNPLCPSGIVSNYASPFQFQSTSPPQVQVYPNVPYPITITVTKPSNPPFVKGNVSCYSVWIQDAAKTQNMSFCRGSIRGGWKWFCPSPIDPPLPLYADSTALLSFPVTNIGDPSGQFNYQIGVISSCSCDSPVEDSIISLNDLPPGTKVTGSINIPLGDSAEVVVTARLTRFKPYSIQEVVLIADWDSTETMTEGPGIAIRPMTLADCNKNGIDDLTDIAGGFSADTNANGMPDECELAASDLCYACGDANGDKVVNIGDAVHVINYIFKSGPAPNPRLAGDANGDCAINVGDAVYTINYIFKSGPQPTCNLRCVW